MPCSYIAGFLGRSKLAGFVPERFDFAGTLPKLYIATVNKLLGGFLGGFVVGALKLNRARDAII
jgi:hypothetical protein